MLDINREEGFACRGEITVYVTTVNQDDSIYGDWSRSTARALMWLTRS